MPSVPLPVIVKLPPLAKVPPFCKLPPVSMPVEKLTFPRPPVTKPRPFRPLAAMSSELLRLNPAEVPERTPELLVKSTAPELANPASGRAITSKAIKTIRFITVFLLSLDKALVVNGAELHCSCCLLCTPHAKLKQSIKHLKQTTYCHICTGLST